MDTNGQVTDAPPAEKPTEGTQQLPDSQFSAPLTIPYHNADKAVDEVTDMFKGLAKKKKSSKKSKTTEEGDEETPAGDGEFDVSALKKKKKKSSKPKPDSNDFEAKLAQAGVAEDGEEQPEEVPEGDHVAGTGIWAHDATQAIPYSLLVSRFFSLIESHHPDLMSSGAKSYKIPPPQCLREGNRRTIFANIAEICKRMNRRFDPSPYPYLI